MKKYLNKQPKGLDEHLKIVKKMFKLSNFKHLPNKNIDIKTLIDLAEKSNQKLALFLKSKIYQLDICVDHFIFNI